MSINKDSSFYYDCRLKKSTWMKVVVLVAQFIITNLSFLITTLSHVLYIYSEYPLFSSSKSEKFLKSDFLFEFLPNVFLRIQTHLHIDFFFSYVWVLSLFSYCFYVCLKVSVQSLFFLRWMGHNHERTDVTYSV